MNYYNSIWQPIEIADFKGDVHFDAYYENGSNQQPYEVKGKTYRAIKSLQLNAKVFELNHIEAEEGTLFSNNDFIFSNDDSSSIPVLLGSDYAGIYKPGDTIHILYYQRPYTGNVVGILSPSQKIITANDPERLLDRYIVLPSMSFDNHVNVQAGRIFFKASLLSKINGIIITDLSPIELNKVMSTISNETHFNDFDIIGANSIAIKLLINMTEANRSLLLITAAISMIVVLLLFLWIISVVIRSNSSVYKVFLISGASFDQLYASTRNQFLLWVGISSFLPLFPLLILVSNPLYFVINYLLIDVVLCACFVIAIHLFIKRTFTRLNIVQQLKG
ncbi:ABC transporter ATP-binding protein [Paenibacillus cellulosilyticus]|nr:ABC transporter ATP-binding protein [Paenibacillus cellulosilyticus]